MTNQIAIYLAALIVVAVGADALLYDWGNTIFIGRKMAELIEWVAFWR
ncbi:MAG: hypothetical protein AAFY74_20030 [Pseudomonadota bacterium]